MRKILVCVTLSLLLALGLAGPVFAEERAIDIDLANASDTVVYAQLVNMMVSPQEYLGKIVRLTGWFEYFEDPIQDAVYFSAMIPDATACCMQGMEFVWAGEHDWPLDYPEAGTEITVCGRFELYEEDGYEYMHLTDAELDWEKD